MAAYRLFSSLALILLSLVSADAAGELHPIVLVPGYGNNQIDARLTEEYKPSHPQCGELKGKGWFRLYLNSTELKNPNYVPCFAEYMSSVYNPITNDYHNIPGVETRVPYFGVTTGFEYQDLDQKNVQFLYMAILVEHLEAIGYKERKTLFGAPYDFRYFSGPPGHHTAIGSAYLKSFKMLVETASKMNYNKQVIIMSHSFGGLEAQQLLVRQPLAWRRRYIKHFIPISLGWGGTVLAMQGLITGSNIGLSFLNPSSFKKTTRSQQTSLSALPVPRVFGNKPLVITKHKNYSAVNMVEFFVDIGFEQGIQPYETLVLPVTRDITAPMVPVTLMNGLGIQTVESLVYGEGGLFNSTPTPLYIDGDGVLSVLSMSTVKSEWSAVPGQVIKAITIANTTHFGMIQNEDALKQVIVVVLEVNSS